MSISALGSSSSAALAQRPACSSHSPQLPQVGSPLRSLISRPIDLKAIFPMILFYLPPRERVLITRVCSAFKKAKIEFDEMAEKLLKNKGFFNCYHFENIRDPYKDPIQIFIRKDGSTLRESVRVIQLLGSGGSKRAFGLENDTALLYVGPGLMAERMIAEEIRVSRAYQEVGLLTTEPQRVSISAYPRAEEISSYLCPSFAQLAHQGIFIIDTKDSDLPSSTWIIDKNFLFANMQDRSDPKNWIAVLDPLFDDIAKICIYGLVPEYDSLNIAVCKNTDDASRVKIPYKIRFFGFDFSSKYHYSNYKRKIDTNFNDASYIKQILSYLIGQLFYFEFGSMHTRSYFDPAVQRLKEDLQKAIMPFCIYSVQNRIHE